MVYLSGVTAAGTLLALSLLHLYWTFGGRWGLAVALPQTAGKRLFIPPPYLVFAVAAALFVAAFLVAGQLLPGISFLPSWVNRWGTWVLAIVFLVRAVGDFHIAGFFKHVKDTPFAYWDTRLFSPLCLALAVMITLVARA
jgi:hypothetical protein